MQRETRKKIGGGGGERDSGRGGEAERGERGERRRGSTLNEGWRERGTNGGKEEKEIVEKVKGKEGTR